MSSKKITRMTEQRRVILEELKKVRKQGYAISYGERIIGALAISVPIKGYFFPVALTILGPEQRLKPKINKLLEEMKERASRISFLYQQHFSNRDDSHQIERVFGEATIRTRQTKI